ncbi:capsule assembly Wzi family protein [Alcanivorax sp.]|uniref:capsule assembly Wzi family protein n=1 Tax=Alcanivorax sp. TaxID=1872427 RepID=UPI00260AB747|nr:capsule assembly Wzi family protein [Alcanivorax sp.]
MRLSPSLIRWLGALCIGLSASSQAATPWVQAGDLTARHHIEALQSQGCLKGVTLSWPISWAALMKGYRLALAQQSPDQANACKNQHSAYLQKALEATRQASTGAQLTLGGATQEPLYTSFSSQVEDEATSQIALYSMGEHWAANLAVGYVDGERDDTHLRFDDTYLAGIVGNWQLGVGAIDRWWGPGWQSSLALSNNARPVPGLWISRQMPLAPESPWLSWIGPWDLQVIAGQLEKDRAVPKARLLGARFVFNPLDSLQIGLTRLAQWGGEGRPQDLDAFWNAVIGRDNGQTSGLKEGEDPSNQIAGFDFRLSLTPGDVPVGVYGQFMGEDEAGGLPSKFSSLAGLDMVTDFGQGSQRFFLEATETVAGSWISERRFNTAYEHGTYRSGFRHYGRNMAITWEGDARALTFGIQQYFRSDVTVALHLSQATLNQDGVIRAQVPTDGYPILQSVKEQDVALAELRIAYPLLGGTFHWLLSASDEPIVTPFEERERWTAGAQWTRDFTW